MARLALPLVAALLCAGLAHAQGDERDAAMFQRWLPGHQGDVAAFEGYLARHHLADVVPLYQLLRSASLWRECRADPFQVPPASHWATAGELLLLLKELRATGVLGPFAVVSAYRPEDLNRCAGGSRGSSHMRFAVDILPLGPTDDQKLCDFWRDRGSQWEMGLSRYPSGRIHVDRAGWRTWGSDHSRRSSFCNQLAQKRPDVVAAPKVKPD